MFVEIVLVSLWVIMKDLIMRFFSYGGKFFLIIFFSEEGFFFILVFVVGGEEGGLYVGYGVIFVF